MIGLNRGTDEYKDTEEKSPRDENKLIQTLGGE
jgi:hypothetical protein